VPTVRPDQQLPRPQQVFISYSRKDTGFVRRLDEELKRRGREAWVDWQGTPPGDKWEKTIYGAIEATHTFIFVLTPDSIASEVCGKEIAHASANNKRLMPIVHRDVAADKVPKSLGELNWIFCRDSDDFEKATDTLVSALDTDLNWVRSHTRLLTRAIEWDANGRNNSFVLRGADLRSAERWLAEAGAQKNRQPTALQTEYIIASKEDETRAAVAAAKKIGEIGSRGSVSLARYSQEAGKSAQALAHLAQALRLNPDNRNASGFTAAMLEMSGNSAAELPFFIRLCRFIVVVEEAAEALAPSDLPTALKIFSLDQFVAEPLVIPFTVVVHDVFGERTTKVSFAERNQPIQAFLLDRPYKSLRVSIAVRRAERDLDGPDAGRLKEVLDIRAPFPVAVADQDSSIAEHPVGCIRDRPAHLPHEGLVRVRRGPDNPDSSRMQFDHKQRVVGDEPADGPDLGREEIRRDNRAPVRTQKRLPRRLALTAWRNPSLLEDRGDR
jgi:tetratricopeptide (TPR) repeat protein